MHPVRFFILESHKDKSDDTSTGTKPKKNMDAQSQGPTGRRISVLVFFFYNQNYL